MVWWVDGVVRGGGIVERVVGWGDDAHIMERWLF